MTESCLAGVQKVFWTEGPRVSQRSLAPGQTRFAPMEPHVAPVQPAFCSYVCKDLLRPLQSILGQILMISVPGGLVCKLRTFARTLVNVSEVLVNMALLGRPQSADKKFVRARGPRNWNPEAFDQTRCSRIFASRICPEKQRNGQGRSVREKSVRANDPIKMKKIKGAFSLNNPFVGTVRPPDSVAPIFLGQKSGLSKRCFWQTVILLG